MANLIIAGASLVFFVILFSIIPVALWISANAAGVRVSLFSLVAMRLRRVPPQIIVLQLIKSLKAGLNVEQDALEAHYLSGGNVVGVVNALIAADKARISLTFNQAVAIDLAGRDLLDAVNASVVPRVIKPSNISAVAKDGIELICTVSVTVRTNIERLVGGAGEETIIARVGEGIVSSIGTSETYKLVLASPNTISKTVLNKKLDSGTAFNILSIDIADINVGRNIGAVLQSDQAEADKRLAQAKAEERRVMAVAVEHEMHARVAEMRAKVVKSQAEVPTALALAYRAGNLIAAPHADQ